MKFMEMQSSVVAIKDKNDISIHAYAESLQFSGNAADGRSARSKRRVDGAPSGPFWGHACTIWPSMAGKVIRALLDQWTHF